MRPLGKQRPQYSQLFGSQTDTCSLKDSEAKYIPQCSQGIESKDDDEGPMGGCSGPSCSQMGGQDSGKKDESEDNNAVAAEGQASSSSLTARVLGGPSVTATGT